MFAHQMLHAIGQFELFSQGTTQKHIDVLLPSADAQDRLSGLLKSVKQLCILRVTFLLDVYKRQTILIHEKGHFDSGAFYTMSSPYPLKEQAERRADRAAILQYIPLEELRDCLAGGIVAVSYTHLRQRNAAFLDRCR